MGFSFNGKTAKNIRYNNQDLQELSYNSTVVWTKSRLPAEYQEVEYIESTGTQYIVTNIIPSGDYGKIVADVFFNSGITTEKCFLGTRDIGSNGAGIECYYNRGIPAFYIRNNNSSRKELYAGTTARYEEKIHYEAIYSSAGMDLEINNSTNYHESLVLTNTIINSYIIFSFRRDNGNPYTGLNFIGRIYNLELYNSEDRIAHFIPCYRKSDNEVGMYDIVNNVFYTNAGTGQFTFGDL